MPPWRAIAFVPSASRGNDCFGDGAYIIIEPHRLFVRLSLSLSTRRSTLTRTIGVLHPDVVAQTIEMAPTVGADSKVPMTALVVKGSAPTRC
jgi:hypothetical protein